MSQEQKSVSSIQMFPRHLGYRKNKYKKDFYMASYSEDQRKCVVTRMGQANIFKQGNGFKFAIQGFVLFKDINNWLFNKCSKNSETATNEYDFSCLYDLTLDDVKKNLNVIFKGVTYSYDQNLHRPSQAQYDAAWNDVENHLFPVQHAYNYDGSYFTDDANSEKTYVSYDAIINRKLIDVVNVTGDQTFDGILFIARPYKNEAQDDGLNIIDPQKPVLFAIQYFANDKLMILKDQKDRLVMNVELHVGYATDADGNDISCDVQTMMPEGYNDDGCVQGLHLADDATTNTLNDCASCETTNKLFISTIPTEESKSYDTFTKLNIMSQAKNNIRESVPQLMFSLAKDNDSKSWDGQRLAFTYASGSRAALFRIAEYAGAGKERANIELLGVNNLYSGVKGVYGNSFIYSQENELPASAFNNVFINSDSNVLYPHASNEISFINSNYNILTSGVESINNEFPGGNNITFMETNNAVVSPKYSTYYASGYKGSKGGKGQLTWTPYTMGGHLTHHFMLDSDFTFINGHNESNVHGTYIASPSAKHIFNENTQNDLEIGNTYGFTNSNSGNLIAIGRGLTYVKGQGDKIILGHFNRNDTDPNNVLIVGDGFVSNDYLKKIGHQLSGSPNNNAFFNSIGCKGEGEAGDMVNYYRHNLLTVNRKGWIGIYSYANPENFAHYGFSGITANVNSARYEIPFSAVYAKLNVYDSMKEFQNTIDNYGKKVQAINNTMPSNKSITITGATDLGTYFDNGISAVESNSIINVTYVTTATSASRDFTTTVSAGFTANSTTGKPIRRVSAYNSLQYLYLRDTENNLTGFFAINN